MSKYIMQRLLLALPTLFLLSVLVFVGLRTLLPVSVVDNIVGEYGRTDPVLRANIEKELGLSGSVFDQYLEWTWGLARGDFGKSLHSGRPILGEIKSRIPVSLELGILGLATGLAWSVPLGVWAAVKQDQMPDYGVRGLAILISSVPAFWIAVLVITFGSIWFNWAPPLRYKDLWDDVGAHLAIMALPALIIGLTPSGGLLRLVRTTMLEVLRQDYVRTAQAKGLTAYGTFFRHALRNALIPLVTVIGVSLPQLIGGTVIFEQIFIIPGMGRYLVAGVTELDYPVIQATVMIFAALLVLSVLLIDISYAWLDPRIRFS